MLAENQPSVCYGLRGMTGLQVKVKGAKTDLPSGFYGGGVQNAIHALVELLSTMHDGNGKVKVDSFYDTVVPTTEEERKAIQALPQDDLIMAKALNVPALFGEEGYSTLERFWTRPTLEINGICGGFTGTETKTIIPCQACAEITCRLVPHQDPVQIYQLIANHIRRFTPPGVTITVEHTGATLPYLVSFYHPLLQLATKAYEKGYGIRPLFIRAGGSIPIVDTLTRLFAVPIVLLGFGLPTANVHAPNEHLVIDNFDKGLRTIYYYWNILGNEWQQ